MSIPDHKMLGGVHQFVWKAEQVSIVVERLVEEKATLTAELTITSQSPAIMGHLHQARLNLTSTVSRASLVRALTERANHLPWADIIEQACLLTLRKHREGEPVLNLAKVQPPESVSYRVDPMLVEGKPNLIYGAGGVGKTYIALWLATLVATGEPDGGMNPERGNVLYLDYETDGDELAFRLRQITAGLTLNDPPTITYRFCYQPLAYDIAEVQRLCAVYGVDLVVVDSAAPACGGNPESSDEALRFFTALRSLRVTSLILAHKTKAEASAKASASGPFGSVFWFNMPRSIWELYSKQTPTDGTMEWGLFHRKHNQGKLHAPLGLRGSFSEEQHSLTMRSIKVADVPELEEKLSLPARVAHALTHGSRSLQELQDELGVPLSDLSIVFSRNKGRFLKVGDRYGLLQGQPSS